jgi:hypothetical protein
MNLKTGMIQPTLHPPKAHDTPILAPMFINPPAKIWNKKFTNYHLQKN